MILKLWTKWSLQFVLLLLGVKALTGQSYALGTKLPCAKLLTRSGEFICYFHTNHLTSTSIRTDLNGNRIQHYEYTAFGRTRFTESTTAFPVSRRYTSQVFDDETGLYYYNARYYDPQLGRFIQPDDIISDLSNPQSYNRYAYCLNNPLRFTDPDGKAVALPVAVAIVAIYFSTERYAVAPENAEQASNLHYRGYTDNVLGWIDLPVGMTRGVAMHGGQALSKAVKAEVKAEVKAANALLHQAEQPGSKAVRQLTAESQKVGMVAEKGGTTAEKVAVKEGKLLGTTRDNLLNAAENPKLRDAINNLYRPGAKVGSGSSMDAYRFEQATGQLLSPKGHAQKLIERRAQLQELLRDPNLSSSDKHIAKDLLIDIQNALGGQ